MPKSRTPQRPPASLPDWVRTTPFDAGRLTSDGGLAWIARADAALGLCAVQRGTPETLADSRRSASSTP